MTYDSQSPGGHAFPNTRWSLVLAAADEAKPSLEALCRRYWYPVYSVARRAGNDVEDAKDLTQGFFAKLLEKGWLESADQEKGRFRTFLVTALKRYMVNEWHREHAAKRGGFSEAVTLDTALAERIDAGEGTSKLTPDALFDRRWALTLLDQAMARLKKEDAGGNFDQLKECLTAGRGEIDYAALAGAMGVSEGAARVAAHRLRKRYRLVIREEVSHTVADESDVDDEMRALMDALM